MSGNLNSSDVARLLSEPTAENRADAAAKVSEQFTAGNLSDSERKIAEEIFQVMVKDAEVRVREALSESLKNSENIPHDVASLWSDLDLDGNVVGVAYLGGTCYANKYNVLQDFNGTPDEKRVLLAHHLGHHFNALHDASNSNYIMAPSITVTNSRSQHSIHRTHEGSAPSKLTDGEVFLAFVKTETDMHLKHPFGIAEGGPGVGQHHHPAV